MRPVNTIVVEKIVLPKERRHQVNVDHAVKLLSRMLSAVETRLEGREFLSSDFSGANIMTGHASTVAAPGGADISDKPNVEAHVKRLNARPALQRAWPGDGNWLAGRFQFVAPQSPFAEAHRLRFSHAFEHPTVTALQIDLIKKWTFKWPLLLLVGPDLFDYRGSPRRSQARRNSIVELVPIGIK